MTLHELYLRLKSQDNPPAQAVFLEIMDFVETDSSTLSEDEILKETGNRKIRLMNNAFKKQEGFVLYTSSWHIKKGCNGEFSDLIDFLESFKAKY